MDSDLNMNRSEMAKTLARNNEERLRQERAIEEERVKDKRRANLVTLASAVMPSVVPALLDFHLERQSKRLGRPSDGPYVNARQVFAVPDVAKEAAAISLDIAEAALALIEERTK